MTIRDMMNWDRPFSLPVFQRGGMHPSFRILQEEMNRLFDHFYSGVQVHSTDWEGKSHTTPAVNLVETPESFRVEVELPGMQMENVEVSTANGYLIIKGERKEEKMEKDENYIRQESSYGSFHRQVALPPTANSDKADASFKNGILTVKVPKKAEAVLPARKIQVKKAA